MKPNSLARQAGIEMNFSNRPEREINAESKRNIFKWVSSGLRFCLLRAEGRND